MLCVNVFFANFALDAHFLGNRKQKINQARFAFFASYSNALLLLSQCVVSKKCNKKNRNFVQ